MSKKEKKPRMIPDVPATPIPGEPGKKRSNFDPTPRSKSLSNAQTAPRRISPGRCFIHLIRSLANRFLL